MFQSSLSFQVGVVLSGGQAAGGHNVIMGVYDMIKQINRDSRLFGFLKGPKGIMINHYNEITQEYMDLYRNMGGFDMICKILLLTTSTGSGRDKIETPE